MAHFDSSFDMTISTVEDRQRTLVVPNPYHQKRRRSRILTTQLSTTSSAWQGHLDPSSNEIITQIRELNKDVDNSIQFIRGVNDIVCATITINFIIGLLALCTVAEIFIGMKYLEDCPLENRIPVFLMVGGCFGLVKAVHVLTVNIRLRKHSSFTSDKTILDRDQRSSEIVDITLNIFLFAWQVIGTYWTYSIWYPKFQAPLHQPTNYCSKHAYLFALVQIGCFCCLVCFMSIFYLCLMAYYRYTNMALPYHQ